jgi:hypothetical protein
MRRFRKFSCVVQRVRVPPGQSRASPPTDNKLRRGGPVGSQPCSGGGDIAGDAQAGKSLSRGKAALKTACFRVPKGLPPLKAAVVVTAIGRGDGAPGGFIAQALGHDVVANMGVTGGSTAMSSLPWLLFSK